MHGSEKVAWKSTPRERNGLSPMLTPLANLASARPALLHILFAAVDDERNPAKRETNQEQNNEEHPAHDRDVLADNGDSLVIAEGTFYAHY
jgi:hypothetical protein